MFTTTNTTPYYTPSGRTPLVGIVLFLVGGIIAAWLLGIVYNYVVEYIPFIYLKFLATIFFGIALGFACARLAKTGKLRSPAKVTILAIIVALVGLWLHWAFFCAFIFNRHGNDPLIAGYIAHLKSPAEIIDSMNIILQRGHFTIGASSRPDNTITGAFLAIIWVIEALIIVGFCARVAFFRASRDLYSETCDCWAAQEKLPACLSAIADHGAFKIEAETGNLNTLLSAIPVTETYPVYTKLTLHAVENDPDCRYLTLEETTITTGKKGKIQRNTKPIVVNLHITPAQHEKIRAQFGAATAPTAMPPAAA